MINTILWRRLDLPSHEVGRLKQRDDSWELSGTAVFSHDRRPCKLDYVVICDSGWRTMSAEIRGLIGYREIDIWVSVDDQRKWFLNGAERSAVSGCIDIDFGFSPSTNLLTMRRLALGICQEAGVRAAWLPFPSLEFELLQQTYRREGANTYRYESGGGAFVRTLELNAVGFVTNYPGLWIEEDALIST
jgi:uncharacterized protein